MNVKDALGFLGFFSMPQSESKGQSDALKPDDKALYEKIVKDLLRFYAERLEHPNPSLDSASYGQDCALIFRQSKSWREVEKSFITISSTDAKIKRWVENWRKRILDMRRSQNAILNAAELIQKCSDKLKSESNPSVSKQISADILRHKKRVVTVRRQVRDLLVSGERDLINLDARVTKNADCQKIIKYINDNWLHLRVFSEWPEVSLDEEKIAVQVQRLKDPLQEEEIPYANLVNASTKAIFLIKQSSQEETPLEYEGVEPGKIIRTTKIELKDKHFAPESPCLKKRSSSMAISDAYIFNTDFAQVQDEDLKEKVTATSATARRLERVAKLALKEVNSKLEGSDSTIDESQADTAEKSNMWLVIGFLSGAGTSKPAEKKAKKRDETKDQKSNII